VSRFLFVVPPLVGHINPTIGVAAELTRRGHQVAWAGVPELITALAGPAATVLPCAVPATTPAGRPTGEPPAVPATTPPGAPAGRPATTPPGAPAGRPADRPAGGSAGGPAARPAGGPPSGPAGGPSVRDRPPDLRGPAALQYLWQGFLCPLAEAMLPGVLAAAARFDPDVLVVDQQAIAGAIAAELTGRPWATSATTSAELSGQLAGLSGVDGWVIDQLDGLRHRLAGPGPAGPDLRFSPYLVLVFSTTALVGGELPAGKLAGAGAVRFVGPALTARPSTVDFPWSFLDPARPAVLVTLGTANAGAGGRFLAAAVDALAGRPRLQGVVVDPDGTVATPPGNVLVRPRVPQLQLLPRLSAVVCHGGHNTVCEALDHGLPLVLAPIRDDQPIVTEQVLAAGAGLRLRFGRATATQIGSAVDAVLIDTGYAAAARRVRDSFRAAGGAAAAAGHLETLARSDPIARPVRGPAAPAGQRIMA
jgi:hypothetical protein